MPVEPAVEILNVSKRYTGHIAVDSLSLTVPRGSVYGLLGPNGAGKTTTIRMVMNIIAPDQGRVRLFGLEQDGRDLSTRIGYLPEERGLYRKMRVVDLLVFLAETKGVERRVARVEAHRWLERLELDQWARKKVDDLSKGMQQKVQFIATVLHQPDLLVLDEPFAGLDPVNTQTMKDTVVELATGGVTVLFSTHIMEQAERLCDSVCIIARGKKLVDGRLSEVKRGQGGRHVIVAVEERIASVRRVFEDRELVARADDYGQFAEIQLSKGASPQTLLRQLVGAGANVTRFEIAEPSLNTIFIALVGGEAGKAPAGEHRSHA